VELKTIEAMIAAEDLHPWYRARLLFVKNVLGGLDPQSAEILDFGCGSGAALETCLNSGFKKILGVDVSDLCINSSRLRGVNVKKIGTEFPILDSKYNLILCLDVLEHLKDDLTYLKLFKEHLHTDGKILISVPAHQFLWSKHDEVNHHFRRYSKKELKKLVSEAELKITYLRYWNSTLFPVIFIQRLLSRSIRNVSADEFALPPKFLRWFLYTILKLEGQSKVFGKLMGVSIVAVLELPR
jgi:2-polyprenyl-3-methyl-5-hydroxy-6-metoxy-1,4-benzoquinol methylase